MAYSRLKVVAVQLPGEGGVLDNLITRSYSVSDVRGGLSHPRAQLGTIPPSQEDGIQEC